MYCAQSLREHSLLLLRVDYQGGHGGIGGTSAQLQELLADKWRFLLWQFGISEFQPH